MIELECLDSLDAERIARGLLQADPDSQFTRILDGSICRDEAYVLIKSGNEYAGFATVTAVGSTCEIYRFFITPEHRNEGVGTIAAQMLEQLLKNEQYACCFLQIDDERAYHFWVNALGPLLAIPTSNMYYKEL